MLPIHPKILAMKLPELPKPLFVLLAQLLVDLFDVLVRKFFQDVPLFVPLVQSALLPLASSSLLVELPSYSGTCSFSVSKATSDTEHVLR